MLSPPGLIRSDGVASKSRAIHARGCSSACSVSIDWELLCRGVKEEDLLRMAAAVEAGTRHPIADAVLATVRERGIDVPSGGEARTQPGAGACSTVEGREVRRSPQLPVSASRGGHDMAPLQFCWPGRGSLARP